MFVAMVEIGAMGVRMRHGLVCVLVRMTALRRRALVHVIVVFIVVSVPMRVALRFVGVRMGVALAVHDGDGERHDRTRGDLGWQDALSQRDPGQEEPPEG